MKTEALQNEKFLGMELDLNKVTLYSMYSLSILVPLVLGGPQLLVGSVVNFLIVYSTLKYGIKRTAPILILPSLVSTITGTLFGGATYFLFYVMPFIIISNFILSYFVSKKHLLLKILGIVLKGSFLYLSYLVINKTFGLPKIFFASIPIQFITASIGFLAAWTLSFFTKE